MRPRPRFPTLSLRGRILLVLLLGAVLPLGIVGAWLVRSTERAGERLLRERLDRTLVQIATEVGLRWVRIRSSLLSVAEHPRLPDHCAGLTADGRDDPQRLADAARQ